MRVWYLASDVTSTYLPTHHATFGSESPTSPVICQVCPSAVEIIRQITWKGTNIKAITLAMEIRLIFLYGSTYDVICFRNQHFAYNVCVDCQSRQTVEHLLLLVGAGSMFGVHQSPNPLKSETPFVGGGTRVSTGNFSVYTAFNSTFYLHVHCTSYAIPGEARSTLGNFPHAPSQ